MAETLNNTAEEPTFTLEELDAQRLEFLDRNFARQVFNFCTDRGYNFGDPIEALTRADTTANID